MKTCSVCNRPESDPSLTNMTPRIATIDLQTGSLELCWRCWPQVLQLGMRYVNELIAPHGPFKVDIQ